MFQPLRSAGRPKRNSWQLLMRANFIFWCRDPPKKINSKFIFFNILLLENRWIGKTTTTNKDIQLTVRRLKLDDYYYWIENFFARKNFGLWKIIVCEIHKLLIILRNQHHPNLFLPYIFYFYTMIIFIV